MADMAYQVFVDLDATALEGGAIYLGVANDDPEQNPIPVYWDAALTVLATQPLRTSGGVIVRDGTPSDVFANVPGYSIRVRNRAGKVVWYKSTTGGTSTSRLSFPIPSGPPGETGDTGPPGPANSTYTTVAGIAAADISNGSAILAPSEGSGLTGATYTWKPGNFAGRKDVIKSNFFDLSEGAWVLPGADSLLSTIPQSSAIRTAGDKQRDDISVKDYGAIGDGTSHPVSEWIIPGVRGRFASLAAVQAEYPDVRTANDTIDFAAFNKAVRVAAAAGGGSIYVPAGNYRAWVYARATGISFIGQGSTCTRITLPNGAQHTITRDGGREPDVTGTPCVLDAGHIGNGNYADAYNFFHISGITLDGNKANVTAPSGDTGDLFGWGLSFTKMSNATYSDLVAINCHNGGVGTFINSNYHKGACTVESCGMNLLIDGTGRPGFDVNSSKHSEWSVIAKTCWYGARLLDNVNNCGLTLRAENSIAYGLLINNQLVNASDTITVDATIRGGCSIAGLSVNANVTNSHIAASIYSITGVAARDVKQASAANDPSGNTIEVTTSKCQVQAVSIGGRNSRWVINSTDDGRMGAAGSNFAVEYFGANCTVEANVSDSSNGQVRGIAARAGSSGLRLTYKATGVLQPWLNAGTDNIWYNSRANLWTDATLNSGYSNAFGSPNPTVGYTLDDAGYVALRGNLSGPNGVAFTLPAGFRPSSSLAAGEASSLIIASDGTVNLTGGSGPWKLGAIRFPAYV